MAQQPPVSNEELNDLFNDPEAIPQTEWAKFTQIGDSLQGILVEQPNSGVSAKFGTPQITYTLQTKEGDIVMFGLNPATNVRAVRQLKQAEVGDEVGIKLASFYESGKGNPGKNFDIRVRHANPTPQHEAEPFPSGQTPVAPVQTALGSNKPIAPAVAPVGVATPEQKLAQIIELAMNTLGATSIDDAKAKVMTRTEIPLIPSRYDEIIVKLML